MQNYSAVRQRPGKDKEKIKAFIFDLDGVLTDTSEYHFRAWKRLADEEGISFNREDNEKLRGVSRRASLELILKDRQLPEEKMREFMDRKNSYYLAFIKSISEKDLLPGALPLLQELRSKQFRLALASASKNAPQVIEGLRIGSFFDVIADGNSVEKTKPAPDLFLFAAEKLAVTPGLCIVVEDAEAGITAARAAGMRTIGIGPEERVGEADYIYPSVAAIRLEDIR